MGELVFSGGVYETLPAQTYCDATILDEEKSWIFRRCWQLIGHITDIPNAGDYIVEDISGMSVIVMRGQDMQIHAFHNVCPHRAHELLQGKGCARRVTCPYHAWTNDTAGQLRAPPNETNFPGFDKGLYRLKPVRAEEFLGLILVNLDPETRCFADLIVEAVPEIMEYAANLRGAKPGRAGDHPPAPQHDVRRRWPHRGFGTAGAGIGGVQCGPSGGGCRLHVTVGTSDHGVQCPVPGCDGAGMKVPSLDPLDQLLNFRPQRIDDKRHTSGVGVDSVGLHQCVQGGFAVGLCGDRGEKVFDV